jgi:hypothetical protein
MWKRDALTLSDLPRKTKQKAPSFDRARLHGRDRTINHALLSEEPPIHSQGAALRVTANPLVETQEPFTAPIMRVMCPEGCGHPALSRITGRLISLAIRASFQKPPTDGEAAPIKQDQRYSFQGYP